MTRRRLVLFAVAARDDWRLRSVVAWSRMAIVASPLVTGCGARTGLLVPNPPPGCGASPEIPIPNGPPGYMVLFPTSAGSLGNSLTQNLCLWHSRTKAISTVETSAFEQATMSFDGRFIAIDRCSAEGACAGASAAGIYVLAPDGTTIWSQPDTDGQTSWEWVGALRPDGQRVVVATIPDPGVKEWSLCVLDRGGTPISVNSFAG